MTRPGLIFIAVIGGAAISATIALAQVVNNGGAVMRVTGAGPISISPDGTISCPTCGTQTDINNAAASTMTAMAAAVAPLATTTAMNALAATIPLPAGGIPLGPNGTGASGAAATYIRADATQRQVVQRTTVTTDGSGNWSVTWATPFMSSTPTVNPIPLNPTASVSFNCNVTTRSSTGATGRCWQLQTQTVALISLTITLAPTALPSTSVMLIAGEPTQ